MYELTTLNV